MCLGVLLQAAQHAQHERSRICEAGDALPKPQAKLLLRHGTVCCGVMVSCWCHKVTAK
jgi:hypothetical protein